MNEGNFKLPNIEIKTPDLTTIRYDFGDSKRVQKIIRANKIRMGLYKPKANMNIKFNSNIANMKDYDSSRRKSCYNLTNRGNSNSSMVSFSSVPMQVSE